MKSLVEGLFGWQLCVSFVEADTAKNNQSQDRNSKYNHKQTPLEVLLRVEWK